MDSYTENVPFLSKKPQSLFSKRSNSSVDVQQFEDAYNTMPRKALEAFYPQGRDKLSAFQPAGIPVGPVASSLLYDNDQTRQMRQQVTNGIALTPEQRRIAQSQSIGYMAGVVTPLSPQKVTSILPRMSGEDQIDMANLLDLTRTKMVNGKRIVPNSPQAVNIEKNARYVAEGMGFNPDQKNADLAKTFEQILNASRKKLFRR